MLSLVSSPLSPSANCIVVIVISYDSRRVGSLSSSVSAAAAAADTAKLVAVSPDNKSTPTSRTKSKVLDEDGKVVEDKGRSKTKGKGKGRDKKKAQEFLSNALKEEIDDEV